MWIESESKYVSNATHNFQQFGRMSRTLEERFNEMESNDRRRNQTLKPSASLKEKAYYVSNNVVSSLVMSLTTSFEIGAFFIQFLDWW